jgi:hypothetical protein
MDNIALPFVIEAILSLILIAGLLFLIIYGVVKKKRAFWIGGMVITAICLFMYVFTYLNKT